MLLEPKLNHRIAKQITRAPVLRSIHSEETAAAAAAIKVVCFLDQRAKGVHPHPSHAA
jgi:hypothetical protein